MKRTIQLLSLIGSLLIIAACGNSTTNNEGTDKGYTEIEATDEVKSLMDEGVQVIDVRTSEEFAEGHIPGATLIPLDELSDRTGELEKDKKYIIVCRSGNRSTQASEILVKEGFSNIYNFTGGMNGWEGEIEK
ncbi:rhodanese-like domain-containing protein [Bacillus tianshenii]|nr:rhodanese-like domain-containing protein [Bacillus tianshenii]